MTTAASLDSFQLIVGLYLIYVAIKGSGTLYNFFDLPEKEQLKIKKPLRLIYGACGVIALTEAALFIWQASVAYTHISQRTLNTIGNVLTLSIVVILAGVFIWLRKLAEKK